MMQRQTMCGKKCNFDEKRLIDASALRKRIEGWMQELEQEFTVEYAYMGYALDDVLDYIDTAPTVQHECTCQKWHPASETPPLHHKVDEDKCEGPIEYDVSEPLLLYTEEEGYKVGVYMKDCYGFNGWLNPEYGGTIHHVVEWQYLPKSSKETGK